MTWVKKRLLLFVSVLAIGYLLLPLAVIMVLSFNKPKGRQNTTWNEFSLAAWTNICRDQTICNAFWTSVRIGVLVTLVATLMGTMISFALIRYRFRGQLTTNSLIFLPIATPEVILGASLLALFLNIYVPLGFWTITIAHILFTISFVVVVVNARLAGLDPRLEQAAMDLYATPVQTFRYVTLPLVLPGVVGAAVLSFSLSFDDFIISNFNSGTVVTFPIYIWGAALRGIPPQVNVIATLMFVGTLAVMALLVGVARSKERASK